MLPHALPGATWEFQGRGVDQHGKEWLCGKEVCQMLRYREEKISQKILYKISQGALCTMDIEDHKKTIPFFLLASSIPSASTIRQ